MKLIFGVSLTLIASLAFADAAIGPDKSTANAIAAVFESEGVEGTLVVATADGDIIFVHNDDRAGTRFSPASTFKVPNSLIALDLAVVESAQSPFRWDGKERGVATWNQDQTLRSAFSVSCVWCYQEIAREVGEDRYQKALASIDYGNQDIGEQVDQFWLNGDLQISANEQIEFLRRLYALELPFRREHVDILKSIMVAEENVDYTLFAKTGWTGPQLHIGWYVGFVETGPQTYLFAMNMRMERADQAALRKDLTVRSLRALKIL